MKNIYFKFCIAACILFMKVVSATDKPYLTQDRVNYVEQVLSAIVNANIQSIYNTQSYINVVDRNNCTSSLSNLRAECLIQSASSNCQGLRSVSDKTQCELYSDIIVVNKLSENVFIPRSERYRILKNNTGDTREVIVNRLEQKYSRLVTQFSLSPMAECDSGDYRCLAEGLDTFCIEYSNKKDLSWQYCMSAIAWFIGTSR